MKITPPKSAVVGVIGEGSTPNLEMACICFIQELSMKKLKHPT
jgi:hypothetical protein